MTGPGSRHDDVLDQVPLLSGRTAVEELPGGLTNTNLAVTLPGATYVVRISGRDTELLGIDREVEHVNTVRAHAAGVGAPVHDYRPDLGVLVIGHLSGRTLGDADLAGPSEPAVLKRAAAAVRRLHAGPGFAGRFDMFERQATYRETIRTRGFALPAAYDEHAGAWHDVRRALAAAPRPLVPCHNDLLAANLIDDGTRVAIIDYEYSGMNEASFELGNTATECGFDDDRLAAWVEAYAGRVALADLARIRLQMLVSAYGWALWGYIQAAVSPIGFDFTGWGDERLEKAAAGFRAPSFGSLLEDVSRG